MVVDHLGLVKEIDSTRVWKIHCLYNIETHRNGHEQVKHCQNQNKLKRFILMLNFVIYTYKHANYHKDDMRYKLSILH